MVARSLEEGVHAFSLSFPLFGGAIFSLDRPAASVLITAESSAHTRREISSLDVGNLFPAS